MIGNSVKGALAIAVLALSGPALAGDLVYTPVNPSFGGNALNSSHLLSLANAQRTATAQDANSSSGTGTGGSGGDTGNTDADLFVRQLQGRLLSALASQVTEAIFGDNPQDHGLVTFGDTTVEFIRTADSIRLIITDPTGVTEIEVPQLVTTTPAAPSSAFAAAPASSGDLVTNLGGKTLTSNNLSSSSLTGGALSGGGLN